MMAYAGETPPERGTVFRLYVLKRVRISLQSQYTVWLYQFNL